MKIRLVENNFNKIYISVLAADNKTITKLYKNDKPWGHLVVRLRNIKKLFNLI